MLASRCSSRGQPHGDPTHRDTAPPGTQPPKDLKALPRQRSLLCHPRLLAAADEEAQVGGLPHGRVLLEHNPLYTVHQRLLRQQCATGAMVGRW